MPIYKIESKKVEKLSLKKDGFGNEFALRDFFAENLEEILGVRFLEKEYQIPNGRIDTLGIDENNSPVIIEYKWKENEEIFAQGLHYLKWLRENKNHFELLVQSKFGADIKVSWTRPRLILIAQGFSRYIKSAVQSVDNVELKAYTLYEGDVLHIENEYSPYPEISKAVKQTAEDGVEDENEVYNLEYHLNQTVKELQKKFGEIREMLLQLPNVEEISEQKSGITYRTTRSFVRFEFRVNSIQILIRDPRYDVDEKELVKDVTKNKWGYLGAIKFTEEIDNSSVFEIIKASYNSTL